MATGGKAGDGVAFALDRAPDDGVAAVAAVAGHAGGPIDGGAGRAATRACAQSVAASGHAPQVQRPLTQTPHRRPQSWPLTQGPQASAAVQEVCAQATAGIVELPQL